MKRALLFISMLCLLLTSCVSDFWKEPDNSFIDAKFTLVINDKYTTRSQASNVDVVTCAVFDASGTELDFNQTVQIQGNKAIYNVKLPNWQNYRIVFFAYKSNSSGGSDYFDISDLKSISIKPAVSNLEEREAFCGYLNLEAADNTNITSFSQPVILDRIFAQLNLGIDKAEYDTALDAGIEFAKTKVKVSNVYKKFSAYENIPVGTPSEMVFEFNDVPSGKFADNDSEYYYLSMNYLLAGNSNDNIYKTDVEFSWNAKDGTGSSSPVCFTDIPIYKNYRTNITGKLITNPAIYNITYGEMVENLQGVVEIPNNEIWYTTSDNKAVELYTSDFVENIVSHTYENGRGTVKFDKDLTKVGGGAFYQCENLTSATIPNTVTSLGTNVFYGCTALKEVSISNNIEEIGNMSFNFCESLEKFYGSKVSDDGRCIIIDGLLAGFAPCGLTTYTIPDGVSELAKSVMVNCNTLTSVNIPGHVKIIGQAALAGCNSIKTINLSEGIESIGDAAFNSNVSMEEITVPNSVNSVGTRVFTGCSSLKAIKGKYSIDDRYLVVDGTLLGFAPAGMNVYELPEGIISISDQVFMDITTLTSLRLPEGLTEIGMSAFQNCKSLEEIIFPGTLKKIDQSAFKGCESLLEITLPEGIEEMDKYAFDSCTSLYSVNLPNSLESIRTGAFRSCTSLKKLNFPEKLTLIERLAFASCTSLEKINIPYVEMIDQNAFKDCTSLTEVTIEDGLANLETNSFIRCSSLTDIRLPETLVKVTGNNIFTGCTSLKNVYLNSIIPTQFYNSIIFDSKTDLSGARIYVYPETIDAYKVIYPNYADLFVSNGRTYDGELTKIIYTTKDNNLIEPTTVGVVSNTMNDGTGEIVLYGKLQNLHNFFTENTYVKSVIVPDCVTTIETKAFLGCTSLEKVVLPEGLMTISNLAFKNCASLKELDIPQSVTSVSSMEVFRGCSSLAKFTGKYASDNNRTLVFGDTLRCFAPAGISIYKIPEGIKAIDEFAFYECNDLEEVIISKDVEFIGEMAFSYCASLKKVTLPESIKTISSRTFDYCTNLESVYCKAIEPPYIGIWCFDRNAPLKIYVPEASVDAYKNHEKWQEYSDKIEGYNYL